MANMLISPSAVLSRLNLQDDDGVVAAVKSALAGSVIFIQEALQTAIDEGEAEDFFFIDPVVHMAVAGTYVLKLSNGFVKKGSVKVFVGDSLPEVQLTATETQPLRVIYERGFVRVSLDCVSQYLRVTYEYGFSEDEEVPLWLQEAATSYTIKLLSSQQLSDEKPELNTIYKFIDAHAGTILTGHLRSMSESILPLG